MLKKEELHDGIDIAVPTGTQVAATADGIVTEIRTSDTYGLLLQFETEDGYTVKYAHLQDTLVQEGDAVTQGQAVALSGNSGLTTGAHLHYSIYKDGLLLDPINFVTLPYTEEVAQEYIARGENLP